MRDEFEFAGKVLNEADEDDLLELGEDTEEEEAEEVKPAEEEEEEI